MKLDPGFVSHWKTERLISELGGDGVVAVLRLWGNAQIKRRWSGLQFTPKRLAMETKWKGDENHLFSVLTDKDAPWLDAEEGGTWAIHDFSEHQKQVIHLWESGSKGGRPKKANPSAKDDDKTSTSYSSYSSSYPICEPNGNQMVSEPPKADAKTKRFTKPTIEELAEYGATLKPPFTEAEKFFDYYESKGWLVGKTGMKNWQSAVRNWQRNAAKNGQLPTNGVRPTTEQFTFQKNGQLGRPLWD